MTSEARIEPPAPTAEQLSTWIHDAHGRLIDLFAGLTDEQLIGPEFEIVNPPLWEVGHVAWFYERWVLCEHARRAPRLQHGDMLYDSAADLHSDRWISLMPGRDETLAYLTSVMHDVQQALERAPDDERLRYFATLGLFHEDMHVEAMLYTRQTLGLPAPGFVLAASEAARAPCADEPDDVLIPAGTYSIGAEPGAAFVFDNEKWNHDVTLGEFRIACRAVTQSEFASFVDDGGYKNESLWSSEGWAWRRSAGARAPAYWTRASGGGWMRRCFDQERALEADLPMIHANWFEAQAYCEWAGRRLPTENEWEVAAKKSGGGTCGPMDFEGCTSVFSTLSETTQAGCRQMIGSVWEWTADTFEPYTGFTPDAYREYSQPWFGTHKVLRGGSWASRTRMIRPTWRNFFTPDRRDIWAGFRTCIR